MKKKLREHTHPSWTHNSDEVRANFIFRRNFKYVFHVIIYFLFLPQRKWAYYVSDFNSFYYHSLKQENFFLSADWFFSIFSLIPTLMSLTLSSALTSTSNLSSVNVIIVNFILVFPSDKLKAGKKSVLLNFYVFSSAYMEMLDMLAIFLNQCTLSSHRMITLN